MILVGKKTVFATVYADGGITVAGHVVSVNGETPRYVPDFVPNEETREVFPAPCEDRFSCYKAAMGAVIEELMRTGEVRVLQPGEELVIEPGKMGHYEKIKKMKEGDE